MATRFSVVTQDPIPAPSRAGGVIVAIIGSQATFDELTPKTEAALETLSFEDGSP